MWKIFILKYYCQIYGRFSVVTTSYTLVSKLRLNHIKSLNFGGEAMSQASLDISIKCDPCPPTKYTINEHTNIGAGSLKLLWDHVPKGRPTSQTGPTLHNFSVSIFLICKIKAILCIIKIE